MLAGGLNDARQLLAIVFKVPQPDPLRPARHGYQIGAGIFDLLSQ
jgi:hypothetical protein